MQIGDNDVIRSVARSNLMHKYLGTTFINIDEVLPFPCFNPKDPLGRVVETSNHRVVARGHGNDHVGGCCDTAKGC